MTSRQKQFEISLQGYAGKATPKNEEKHKM